MENDQWNSWETERPELVSLKEIRSSISNIKSPQKESQSSLHTLQLNSENMLGQQAGEMLFYYYFLKFIAIAY